MARKIKCIVSFLVGACIAFAGPSLHAAEFTADMLLGEGGKTTSQSKLYVKDYKYRMDRQEGDQSFVVIVDEKAGTTTVHSPSEKKYMQVKSASLRSMSSNPIQSFRYHAETYSSKEAGQETYQGFDCRKVLVQAGDRHLFTAWVSKELDFPLKILFHLGQGRHMELQNIEPGPVQADLLAIPAGYTLKEHRPAGSGKRKKAQGPERKPWMEHLGSAKTLAPPVDKEMEAGEILRLPIDKNKALNVFTSSGIKVYAFDQGQPVMEFKRQPRNKIYLSPREAEELVLYNPSRGRFNNARVKQGDMPERVLVSGEKMRMNTQPGAETVGRFINLADGDSTVYYSWLSQGKELPRSDIGPESFRTKNLDPGKNFRSIFNQIEGDAPGDTLLVEVRQGKVLLKAGQPFTTAAVKDAGQNATSQKPQAEPAGAQTVASGKAQPATAAKEEATPAPETSSRPAPGKNSSRAANIMFILDASGSMWGEVEGRDKIAIAKEVLAGLVKDLPDNTRAGLVAYGHRRKGDCQDVEELVKLGPLDREGLIEIIQGLSPKGKTPITRSVRMTAQKLKSLEEETTIILVSDGKETCEGDPCELVQELKEAGLKFVLHVIGFDVTEEERRQLECMAEAGGGKYFTAKTAGEFEAAAQEVVQESRTVGFLEVAAMRNDKPVSARVEVLDQDSGEHVRTAKTSTNEEDPAVLRLKPGTYKVIFKDEGLPGEPSMSFSDVQIELGQSVSRTASFAAGTLHLSAMKEGKSIHALARIYQGGDLATSGWLEEGRGKTFKLLPGRYRVQIYDKSIPEEPLINIRDIEIQSGQNLNREVNFSQEGQLKVEAFKDGKSVHVLAKVYQDGKRIASGWLEEGKGRTFKLLPGSYRVELVDKSIPQNPEATLENIQVQPGQTVTEEAEFSQEGQLKVEAFKDGKSVHVLAKVYQDGKRIASGWLEEGKGRTFKLLPGSYRVELVDKSIPQNPEATLENIQVQPGQTVTEEAEFSQEGQLKVEAFKDGKSVHVLAKVYQDGKRIASGWLEEGKGRTFKLLPGTYSVEIKGPDGEVQERKGISIQSGQQEMVSLQF